MHQKDLNHTSMSVPCIRNFITIRKERIRDPCEAFNPYAELNGRFFKKRVPKIAIFHRFREADLSIYCRNEGPKK
jgi:hypothetical protein